MLWGVYYEIDDKNEPLRFRVYDYSNDQEEDDHFNILVENLVACMPYPNTTSAVHMMERLVEEDMIKNEKVLMLCNGTVCSFFLNRETRPKKKDCVKKLKYTKSNYLIVTEDDLFN
jgi:hypothetical protein